MIFNSIDFAIFLPIVFILYWSLNKFKIGYQNMLLLIASYVFYGWWDYRFLSLILFSTIVDYSIGLYISKTNVASVRRYLLLTSVVVNIGLLGFFKYYNFFVDSFVSVFRFFGQEISPSSLNIILPVGISFYTFQTLSYTIDVYRKKLQPTTQFIEFAAFVSFFPQLVAGPIERASHLLPQFSIKRVFNYNRSMDGLRQILWGLFKKVVIADNCAKYVNLIFDNYTDYSGSTLLLGAVLFAFQIYGDFSGYSDIAIGVARLFGFDLKQNFAFPYFSRSVAEFWRRWHISLTTWFRDYLYIPLGGSRVSKWKVIRNVFIIFIVSGFWHGANWTFIIWGFLNALYFIPSLLRRTNRSYLDTVAENRVFPSIKEVLLMLNTFLLITLSWVFFRAESVDVAILYLNRIFSPTLFTALDVQPLFVFVIVLVFLIIEWAGRQNQYAIEKLFFNKPQIVRWVFYYAIIMITFLYGGDAQEFIYFQF